MNVNDSEKIAGILESRGYQKTDKPEDADVVIVNTCTVREKPDNKALSFIGSLKSLKKKKKLILAVGGCLPQRAPELIKKHKHVDIIFGTFNFMKIDKFIENLNSEQICEILDGPIEEEKKLPLVKSSLETPFSAFVTVQRGCNRFCSYCIVPFTRGRERSVDPKLVVEEVKSLADAGVKEVCLLGQNIDFYRYGNVDFAELLYMVAEVKGIERIRFQTSHPAGFNEKIAKVMSEIDKICPFVHLPPQSGSNRILKLMNRGYTAEEYIEKVDMLRSYVEDVCVSGDFIVGFPTESEKDFEETMKLVERCKISHGYVFEYCPRPLTKASQMEDDVPKEVKNRRLKELQDLLKKMALEEGSKKVGKVEEVLVDGRGKKENQLSGRTRDNRVVIFEGKEDLVGKFVKVRITRAFPHHLEGVLT